MHIPAQTQMHWLNRTLVHEQYAKQKTKQNLCLVSVNIMWHKIRSEREFQSGKMGLWGIAQCKYFEDFALNCVQS